MRTGQVWGGIKMSTGETTQERYYPSKELCARLDISDSTLRKWCIALEKQNYSFTRTEQNRRLFVEQDLEVLDYLKELIQNRKMSLENASIIVESRFCDVRSSTGTPSVPPVPGSNDKEVIGLLNTHIEKQEQLNQELLKRLDEQSQYINKRLNQQDERLAKRDESLMGTMNQLMEQRKEQIKLLELASEEKPNWFTKMFKKKG